MASQQNVVEPQKNTFGGFQTATMYSGAVAPGLTGAYGAVATGSDVLLFSGPGRLDSITLNPAGGAGATVSPMFSGVALPIIFYDAGTVSSGGPFSASGHKIIGFTPAVATLVAGLPVNSGPSQLPGQDLLGGIVHQIGVPFMSGLAFNSRSGQLGFTVAWTPEIARQ